jgi:DNA polymerase-3 subunit gamma/tau
MAYQVLARKYRPQRFSDVAGQDHVTRTLGNALEQERVAHGYIFSGHRGIGKTTIARILAMALNCRNKIGSPERPSFEPCAVCDSCKEIRAGNSLDVVEIDAATNRGIDEIRELRDAARYAPARDRYKIYLLDEAHQITDAAFNALLKTLEEPPEHVVFMMATTQPEDIPQTIRSRCQHFSFHAVKFDDIVTQLTQIALQEGILADPRALALLAEAGDGSMRDALSIMDQAIASAPLVEGKAKLDGEEIRELMGTVPDAVFERMLEFIGEGQSAAVMEELNRLLNNGNSPSQMARQLVRYLRNCLMAKLGGAGTELLQISGDERARAMRSAALFGEEDLTRFLQVMLRTFDELNYRQEPRLHLELGLMKLVHLQRLLPLEEILSGLPGASRPAIPRPASSGPAASRPSASAMPIPRPEPPKAKPAAPSPFELDRQRKQEQEAEPVPETVQPEPVAVRPEPVAVAPQPEPAPVPVQPEPERSPARPCSHSPR